MQAHGDAITGATARSVIEVLLQRPLAPRPDRSGELTRWQAFNVLWRQNWHAPEPEDRRVRWFAGIFTVLWHVFFGGLVLWLTLARFLAPENDASKRRGEEVVQVEFIGRGAPEAVGGAPTRQPPTETGAAVRADTVPAAESIETAEITADLSAPAPPPVDVPIEARVDAPAPKVEQRAVAEPLMPPAPAAEQEVAVSAPTPESADFVLPPGSRIVPPQLAPPDVAAPDRQLQAVEIPEPVQPLRRETPQPSIAAPRIDARIPEVARREVAAPLPRAQVPEILPSTLPPPTVRAPDTTVRTREIPTSPLAVEKAPSPGTSQPSTTTTTQPAASGIPATSGTLSTMQPGGLPSAVPAGDEPSALQAGQGPRPIAAPGSFPTPVKSDDWGASTREVPGGQRGEPLGLYDAEGGPRLTDSPVNTGQPPGTLDDRIIDLDRSGTWLKRKPTPYEATTFDKYWLPKETLLEEWVRKGIKRMVIPIPGTNKKIECIVSILALGGGCGISDPNLNEQPAGARPPPDIPFKPHLREDSSDTPPPEEG